MSYSPQEQAEREYWLELAELLGWTLIGWNGRRCATFGTGSSVPHRVGCDLSFEERDAIMAAIKKGGAK